MKRTLSEHLAGFLAATRPADIPPAVLNAAKYYTLDWLGSAVAGTTTEPGRMLLDYAAGQTGQGATVPPARVFGPGRDRAAHLRRTYGATVIGLDEGRNADLAALTNGGLSHIVEMDDLHRASVLHPGTVVIPAALAVAEREGRSGLDFLTAVVLGYEVAIRVGEAVGKSHYQVWHNTATCGVFGAAAAAGWLLRLTANQMVWALGNAGTMSAGLWEFLADGAMSKHLHAGRAASSGVLAADLARRGFTGARRILEGERGFFAATSSDAQPERVIQRLAPGMAKYKITGVSIKPHASCRHTHPTIDAALILRREHELTPEQIEAVEVETYRAALALCDKPAPETPYAAKFSLQYCVSCALARGRAGLTDFEPVILGDETIGQLLPRVSVRLDEALDARYPQRWTARVRVITWDGEALEALVLTPKGDPANPLSWAELEDKFRAMVARSPAAVAGGTGYRDRVEAFIKKVRGLDRLSQVREVLAGTQASADASAA